MSDEIVTAVGTPNIALVKYWGKRDFKLNLPTNSSISITLDESLNTRTSVLFSDKLKEDNMYINGESYDLNDTTNEKSIFTSNIINYMRGIAKTKAKALIVSKNSFPTASGLASSASGAATLSFAVSKALGLDLPTRELSIIARNISGSACRGVIGGFVIWKKGDKPDGSDSFAETIVDEKYWPEVIDIITLVSSAKKKISSSDGHRMTPSTSDLYKIRPEIGEAHVEKMKKAIIERDFQTLGEITIRDSNSLHATMLDTYPPIMYLNDVSKQIIYAIHELNKEEREIIAAYTFDAGPNAQLITLNKHKEKVINAVKDIVGKENTIVAGQGSGPRLLTTQDSLIDENKLAPR
jgi:diphosphomevalonate decarboxylase